MKHGRKKAQKAHNDGIDPASIAVDLPRFGGRLAIFGRGSSGGHSPFVVEGGQVTES
jgi:hypothetical protein